MEASQTDYRILAADDEEELLDILELYLEREGIGIRKARDEIGRASCRERVCLYV